MPSHAALHELSDEQVRVELTRARDRAYYCGMVRNLRGERRAAIRCDEILDELSARLTAAPAPTAPTADAVTGGQPSR